MKYLHSEYFHSEYFHAKYLQPLVDALGDSELAPFIQQVPGIFQRGLDPQRYGDLPAWEASIQGLPPLQARHRNFKSAVEIGSPDEIDENTRTLIETKMRELIPWRKGPLWLYGIHIDTEWHSDWKWERVLPHIQPLNNRLVLDVGCGNGYYALRMLGAGAKRVIGVDPSPRFVAQFYALKHFMTDIAADVVPCTLDDMPQSMPVFDTVFSMGVLYHRPSPIDHLRQLKAMLRPGGELVLETLIIEGGDGVQGNGQVLVPEGRYAMMNNVWFLPSADTLLGWMRKCGFVNPRFVDGSVTTTDEQRSTDWMTFHSLDKFLDPKDPSRTVEGHPAPYRGIFVAQLPA